MALTYQTLFLLGENKKKRTTGLSPIYLRITCAGKRVEFSLNEYIDENQWDAQIQGPKAKSKSPVSVAIREVLQGVAVKLRNYSNLLYERNELITAELLKAHLQGKTETQKTVLQAFQIHLRHNGHAYSPATSKKYGYCKTICKTSSGFISNQVM